MPKENHIDQTRLLIATVVACGVLALQDDGFKERFEAKLQKAYDHLRDMEAIHTGTLETLKWTKELIRELA